MLDGPLEFLSGYQDLAEDGVDASLARIETCSSNDGVLVIQEKPAAPVSISTDHDHLVSANLVCWIHRWVCR
jgi:hypothetical protein